MDDDQVVAAVAAVTDAPDKAPETPAQPDPEPETVTLPKAEADALRRRVAEAEKAQRKFEADRKKAEEERQAEQGKWQELAQQRERELNEANERSTRIERDQRVTRLASRLKFIDPSDVVGRLSAEDAQDDASAQAALARIADASPHLIAKEPAAAPVIGQVLTPSDPSIPAPGRPQPPPGKAPLQSLDEANALSQAEAVARMDEIEWLERQEPQRRR